MRHLAWIACALALASCSTRGDHKWNPIDGNGVPLSQGRHECIDEAWRATEQVRGLKERVADNYQVFNTCMALRGY